MSRIGKKPIALPSGVTAQLAGTMLSVKGPKGSLSENFAHCRWVKLAATAQAITVERQGDANDARAQHGLVRALVQNMVTGVTKNFTRDLEIVGIGLRAEVKGKVLGLSLGFSHPVSFPIPDGIAIAVDKQTRVTVSGADRSLVGETAARIRRLKPPEPYKGKGIKYADEVLLRKVGKAAAGAKTGAA